MKNIKTYKVVNKVLFLSSVVVAFSIYTFVKLGYCAEFCSLDYKVGIINPAYQYFLLLTIISGIFLFLPVRYFKTWFKYLLPVATILTFIHASGVSVNTSGVLSMSRAEVVRFDMTIFGVASLFFVITSYLKEKLKSKKPEIKK